jgi:hypothetical protein
LEKTNLEFDLFYAGPDKDYYRKIAPPNLHFLNPIKHDEIRSAISRYNLVIGGSQDGSIRMCELESMALGIPTLFPFKHNEFYAEPLPMFELNSENICKYYGNYDFGKDQKIWVKKYHNVSVVVDKLLHIYKEKILRT